VRPRAVPPPEQSHSTQVDDDLSIDADADDDVSCASDSFDEDSTDDLPVGGTVDMDDAVRSTSTSSWSWRVVAVTPGRARSQSVELQQL
jgi:hypothetical protein